MNQPTGRPGPRPASARGAALAGVTLALASIALLAGGCGGEEEVAPAAASSAGTAGEPGAATNPGDPPDATGDRTGSAADGGDAGGATSESPGTQTPTAGARVTSPAPPSDDRPTDPATPWLVDVTAESGIAFVHDGGADGGYAMPEIMGAGGAMLDVDRDGDLDLLLVGSGRLGTGDDDPAARNRLLRREADGRYVDVTDGSGLDDAGYGMGVAVADYDGDGWVDVYVTNHGPDALYRNRGDGTFEDVTEAAGIDNARWACSATWVDVDGDGHLDLYVTNYVAWPAGKVCSDSAGRPEYCGPLASPPEPDVLYRNRGDGTFEDVSAAAGIADRPGRGLGVLAEDFDGDGHVDLFVANDGEANFLWINRGDGTFEESALASGVAANAFGQVEASMGVAAGDADGDGDLDLFMTHMMRETNTFYRNLGQGLFDDASGTSGLGPPSLPFTGFGTLFADLDLDGNLDLIVVNGRIKQGRVDPSTVPGGTAEAVAPYAERNQLFLGIGGGRFREGLVEAGDLGRHVDVSRGLVLGDVDGDGDLDVLVTNCHGPARLYRNDAPRRGRWLMVRPIDPRHGGVVPFTTVTVEAGGRRFVRTGQPGGSYLSAGPAAVHVGLGPVERVDAVEVRWPDGTVDRVEDVAPDRVLEVTRTVAAPGAAS